MDQARDATLMLDLVDDALFRYGFDGIKNKDNTSFVAGLYAGQWQSYADNTTDADLTRMN